MADSMWYVVYNIEPTFCLRGLLEPESGNPKKCGISNNDVN